MGKSPRRTIALAGTRMLCLHVLALLLTLLCESGVTAVTFAFSGFQNNSIYLVSGSHWTLDSTTACLKFDAKGAGRFLFPGAVQMRDPGSTTVKSFSTSFIYRLQILPTTADVRPGMAFILVPDNVTIGAHLVYMGLITADTPQTSKNYEADNHTLGVELDTHRDSQFNDPNGNHIGINLASMNSTFTIDPVYHLNTYNAHDYQQIWIDYFEADSRMEIYYAKYNQGKPAMPQGNRAGLDLTLLKENMFVGFTTATQVKGPSLPWVCAWSFSNDGILAPPIAVAQDAPSATPAPSPYGPDNSSLPPPPATNPFLSRTPNPPTTAKKGGKKKKLTGVYVGVSVAVLGFGIVALCICWLKFRSHPLRTFVCHAGGEDGSGKRFPTWLVQTLRRRFKWSNITFFFDRDSIVYGEIFATRIFSELARADLGIVVVTETFFERKWPMTELITFVEAQMNNPTGRLRLLPLFYQLTPDEIKTRLTQNFWEPDWEKMSEGNHPLEVEKCRQAVNWLCSPRGVVYFYYKRDQDDRYIEEICQILNQILRQERSFASYLWTAIMNRY